MWKRWTGGKEGTNQIAKKLRWQDNNDEARHERVKERERADYMFFAAMPSFSAKDRSSRTFARKR